MRLYTKTELEQKLIVNFGSSSNSNSYSKMETFWMGKLSEKWYCYLNAFELEVQWKRLISLDIAVNALKEMHGKSKKYPLDDLHTTAVRSC